MRAKVKLKFSYFTVFIFLAILFLINTRTVFAGRAGNGNFGDAKTTTFTPVEDLQNVVSSYFFSASLISKRSDSPH